MQREPKCQRRKKEARKDEEVEGIRKLILYSPSVPEENCSRRVKTLRVREAVVEEAVADEEVVEKGVVEVMGKCAEKEEAVEPCQEVEVEERAEGCSVGSGDILMVTFESL